jgi:ABC-type transport system substrate-binding protein
MRKFSTKMIFILLLSSILIPFFPVTAQPTPAQIPRLKVGVTGGMTGSWDSVAATSGFHNSFGANSLEPLMVPPEPAWSGEYDDLIPVLATNWTIHAWPEEMNNHPIKPFINRGGIRALDMTLREDVKFHDGTDFNATVAKWNIDRQCVMSGNITGTITAFDLGASKSRTDFWVDANEWVEYETASWNVSKFVGKPGRYAEFGEAEEKAMEGLYCRIKNVTILDNKESGGTIRVNFNDWGGAHTSMMYVYNTIMISMHSYRNYFDIPIYGLGQDDDYPQPHITGVYPDYKYPHPDVAFPGHMIGTGPYIFMVQDQHLVGGGWMKRNPNWWNSSDAQADGWHQVEEIGLIYFYEDAAGLSARNLAMTTGAIHLAYDNLWAGNLVYEEMVFDPDINYFEVGYEPTRTFITLNGINETYWKTWADNLTYAPTEVKERTDLHDIALDGTITVDGINRALRKALSYTFDYDLYLENVTGERGIRAGGFLGVENEYYNPSIPKAYRNLTIARRVLLNDPYWAPKLATRNLDINNATADWNWVAINDPIFKFKLLWEDSTKAQADLFSTCIRDIGIRLDSPGPKYEPNIAHKLIPEIYQVMIMRLEEFPAFTYHGVPTNWPDVNIGNLAVLEYYYLSPGLPYVNGSGVHWPSYSGGQFFNIAFHYNATVDRWIELIRFSDRATTQEIFNNLTRHVQTWQYPEIFISHTPYGYAIDKDWEHSYHRGEQFAFIKYLPAEGDDGIQIPGFHTVALLAIAIVTTTGIVYSLNRKRNRAEK